MARTSSPKNRQEFTLPQGRLVVDFDQRNILLDNQLLELSRTEFGLLVYLAEAAPRVVTSLELIREVQGYASEESNGTAETLRFHIYRLRRKIKEATSRVDLLRTVRGVGYTLYDRPVLTAPSGLITFLFSDIERSTQLWEQYPREMKTALARHDVLLRQAVEIYGGYVFKTMGDEFCIAFADAVSALLAALAAQRALQAEKWAEMTPLRVKMALYTGVAEERDGDYFGPALNHVARLLAAGHGGQILLALTTHEKIAEALPAEVTLLDLGLRRFRGLKEPERVFQVAASGLPENFPPLKTLDPRPSNLPGELTAFIGRETELESVCSLLRRADVRLVTLVGLGGVGKTRLSLRVATNLLDEHEDGVFFVSLAALFNPNLIASAIAQVLGVHETSDRSVLENLIRYLHSRQTLLVLDNFEQLVEGAPMVNELLRGAPQLKVLATSRVALQIYGEQQYRVAPLALPDARQPLALAKLAQYPATQLFLERAQAHVFGLNFMEADVAAIVEICANLDGLPLAIELAAAQMGQFELTELAHHLQQRLKFLTAGPRDVPARQQTLRNTLDWSFELLTAAEQTLFARLAVFVGGCTEAAAAAVTDGPPLATEALTRGLLALTLKSLLQVGQPPESAPRFSMLETIREYAWECLEARGELAKLRQRHAAYYLILVEAAEPGLSGTGNQQGVTLAQLELEHNNLRAALAWALEQAEAGDETALRLSGVLWRFWGLHSYLNEGRRWLEQVLVQTPDHAPKLRAKCLHGAGRLALFQGDYAAAQRFSRESLALYQKLEDKDGIAWAYNNLGEIAFTQGDTDQAQLFLHGSLKLHRVLGHKLGIAKTLDDLGRIALGRGEAERAEQLFSESLGLRRASGSTEGVALALMALSEALRLQDKYAQAEGLTQESLDLYRELQHTAGVAACLQKLAYLRGKKGSFDQSIALFAESLHLLRIVEEEEKQGIVQGLVGLAGALAGAGKDVLTVQVLSAAEVWMDSWAIRLSPTDRDEYDHHRATARAQLGKAAWTRAWAKGQVMGLEDILAAISPPEAS